MSRILSSSKGNVGCLWKCSSVKGTPQGEGENFLVCVELGRGAEGSSRVVCRPGGPFVSPQGSQISLGIVRGISGFLAHSGRVETGDLGSSCVEEWNSACLSCCPMGEMSLVEMYLEPTSFSGRCNLGVSAPSCCDFILRFTFEEVPGHWGLS